MQTKADRHDGKSLSEIADQVTSGLAPAGSAFLDLGPEVVAQRQYGNIANGGPRVGHQRAVANAIQRKTDEAIAPNRTGLPDQLKAGIESLSGISMDGVKVHYNSSQPAQLNAHAYAQGSDIYIAPGQEQHLSHEAWHLVQQHQGRVKATMQLHGGVNINDEDGLEKEADVMGAKALLTGRGATTGHASPATRELFKPSALPDSAHTMQPKIDVKSWPTVVVFYELYLRLDAEARRALEAFDEDANIYKFASMDDASAACVFAGKVIEALDRLAESPKNGKPNRKAVRRIAKDAKEWLDILRNDDFFDKSPTVRALATRLDTFLTEEPDAGPVSAASSGPSPASSAAAPARSFTDFEMIDVGAKYREEHSQGYSFYVTANESLDEAEKLVNDATLYQHDRIAMFPESGGPRSALAAMAADEDPKQKKINANRKDIQGILNKTERLINKLDKKSNKESRDNNDIETDMARQVRVRAEIISARIESIDAAFDERTFHVRKPDSAKNDAYAFERSEPGQDGQSKRAAHVATLGKQANAASLEKQKPRRDIERGIFKKLRDAETRGIKLALAIRVLHHDSVRQVSEQAAGKAGFIVDGIASDEKFGLECEVQIVLLQNAELDELSEEWKRDVAIEMIAQMALERTSNRARRITKSLGNKLPQALTLLPGVRALKNDGVAAAQDALGYRAEAPPRINISRPGELI